jgi:hypothetical protein
MFLYFESTARDLWLYRAGPDGCVVGTYNIDCYGD